MPYEVEIGALCIVDFDINACYRRFYEFCDTSSTRSDFKNFELLSTSPQASSVSQNGFVGLRTWAFKLPFEPGATAMVDLEFRPLHIGTHLLNFQVCNAYYDCSALATDIEVRETQQ